MIIGICGYARSGKDTLFSLLKEINPSVKRFAFADALKRDLEPFIWQKFGWDIFFLSDAQKAIVRPILIAYGCAQRENGDGLHWVREVDNEIDSFYGMDGPTRDEVPVITDFRFPNEVKYFKEKYGDDFILVEVSRDEIPDPPNEEKLNQPQLSVMANIKIHWPTIKSHTKELMPYATSNFVELFNLQKQ